MKKTIIYSLIIGTILCVVSYGIISILGQNETSKFNNEKRTVYNQEVKALSDFSKCEGVYITSDRVDLWSSFLPELKLTLKGEFALYIGINSYLKGNYILKNDQIVFHITENTTGLLGDKDKDIVFKIQDDNTLIFSEGLPQVIKPSAIFKKPIILAESDDNGAHETLSTWGTEDNVETFLTILERTEGKELGKENNFIKAEWYNITPQEVLEKTGGQIFKSSSTCDSFLLYEGEIYRLGISFGGLGVMDIKVCDFDQDEEYELLYTYSWGSGLHRSHVGHFDLKTRKETQLDFVHLNEDMMIAKNLDGTFSLYEVQVEWGKKIFIDFNLTPKIRLADLVYKEGKLKVIEISGE